jgi:hypothetical protein
MIKATNVARAFALSAVIAGAVAAILVVVGAAGALSDSISGNFSSQQVSGPSCTSPVGLCTQGALTGGLKSTFTFTATSLTATADTPTTGVLQYTGDIAIQAKGGNLVCKDSGAFQTTGMGAVSSVCVIVSGTGSFAGASGVIQFVGTFTAASGGQGDYHGAITTP